MKLIRLTYFSRNRLDLFNAPMCDRVAEIVAASRVNNAQDGLDSVVVYDAKWFAQEIEGDERAIVQRFERIVRDPRHCDVSLVAMTPIAARSFPNMSMIAIAHDIRNADLFLQYGGTRRFDPQRMTVDGMTRLIEALVDLHIDAEHKAAEASPPRKAPRLRPSQNR